MIAVHPQTPRPVPGVGTLASFTIGVAFLVFLILGNADLFTTIPHSRDVLIVIVLVVVAADARKLLSLFERR